ncbi:hypothetical protein NMG60_11002793 [Bertholletia excelsa]
MATPREHIEEIRTKKFKIGEEPDPKNEDLHHAVNYLSAELYAKDVHFLMELIQNAEDNDYPEEVQPSLEFVITSKDITATGAPATLLVFNNERGFSSKNIESICSIGRSTKKGNRKQGYIGEKGIGFKSVFLITARPYIFSNGYQIRFSEEPCPQCKVGYIVPEWVDDNPTLSALNQIYGSDGSLPTTTFVLPLKPDKVGPVKRQLSSVHPELLLFLSKIRRLSVKEDNEDPKLNTISAISISSEKNFERRKNIDADSYLLHLSADENGGDSGKECSYHMWRQRFPVKYENRVEKRNEVEEWRLNRGMGSPGVYAFLPTEMVTNLPFIIQADFLLASSREAILLGNIWNQGILDCLPSAFISAFTSLIKSTEDAPMSSLPRMFEFLPINSSPYDELNDVRENIRRKLLSENIIPCESYVRQKFFQKPSEVGRLMPSFWNILNKAREEGVGLHNLSSHGTFILSSSFDREKYNHILDFLGVKPVEDEWYAKCIRGSNLVLGASEEVYLDLLLFLADNWRSKFQKTSIRNIPLLKYVNNGGDLSVCSVSQISDYNAGKFLMSREPSHIMWLFHCQKEFRCAGGLYFLPASTQEAIQKFSRRQVLLEWLSKELQVEAVTVHRYATLLSSLLRGDRKLAVTFVHFLYHSRSKDCLSEQEVKQLCRDMPLVDNYGQVNTSRRRGVIVPANGSNWVNLMIRSDPWRHEGFIELGEDYMFSGIFAGVFTPQELLLSFLVNHVGASDVPCINPPNSAIPTLSAPLSRENAFLLLDWISNLRRNKIHMPSSFLKSIKEGSWLRISLSGCRGYRPPSQSFMPTSSWADLQNESVLVDIPIIDRSFYGEKINEYKEELGAIGVMFEYGEACQFIGKNLMSLAASSNLTRGNVLSILKFIRFLRRKYVSPKEFMMSIREGNWLKTTHGFRSPVGSVLSNEEWTTAAQISNIPFIDQNYYGEDILCFKTELRMLGVIIEFNQNYQLVADCLKSSPYINATKAESVLFVLECLYHLRSSDRFVKAFKDQKFLKTNMGYRSPVQTYLFHPEWGCLLRVFDSFAILDESFYGSEILLRKDQLKQLGVIVEFEEATKAFANVFKQQASLSSLRKEHILSFLACYRMLKGTSFKFPEHLKSCIHEVRWLRTRLGDYRIPRECILFGPDWESIAPISLLPFIDDTDNYYGKGINEYKKELKSLGVVLAFKDGCRFVADGLWLPSDPCSLTPANVYSLLKYIRCLQEKMVPLPETFVKKIVDKKWLKTNAGHRSPNKCLLFDSSFSSFLEQDDGPFIDAKFYGSKIVSFSKELSATGVTTNIQNGCHLLASHLDFHSNFTTICRIYSYLREFKWVPDRGEAAKVWIPNGSDDGEWVTLEECVLRDKDGLFDMQLNVLEKHYDAKLLGFFSTALGVKAQPSLEDYCKLWKVWESSEEKVSHEKCCAFWQYIIKHWSWRTEKIIAENISKLPVCSSSDGILLVDKHDVFIADDLKLKHLFDQSSSPPLFVWYPQPSLPSLPLVKLLEIYSRIGARNISEAVQKEETSITESELKQVNLKEHLIGKGLLALVLGFLGGPSLNMESEKRHEALRCLLDLNVLEKTEPTTIFYTLSLSSGEILKAEARSMIRWERGSKKLFAQKIDRSSGHKSIIEYATYFSEAISEGLLWDNEDQMHQLAELIKLGFLVEFNEEAIEFLMKTKNLQLFLEDDRFLSSAFPPS